MSKEEEYKQFITEVAQVFSEDNIGVDPEMIEDIVSRDEHSIHILKEEYEQREQEYKHQLQEQQQQLKLAQEKLTQEREEFETYKRRWMSRQRDEQERAHDMPGDSAAIKDLMEHVNNRDQELRDVLVQVHHLTDQYIAHNKREEYTPRDENEFVYLNINELTTSLKNQIIALQESFLHEVKQQQQDFKELLTDPGFLFTDTKSGKLDIADENVTKPAGNEYDFDAFKKRLQKYHKQLNDWYTAQAVDQAYENELVEEEITPQTSADFFTGLKQAKEEEMGTGHDDFLSTELGDWDPEGSQRVECRRWEDYYIDGKSIREWFDELGPGAELLEVVERGDASATLHFDTGVICTLKRLG